MKVNATLFHTKMRIHGFPSLGWGGIIKGDATADVISRPLHLQLPLSFHVLSSGFIEWESTCCTCRTLNSVSFVTADL